MSYAKPTISSKRRARTPPRSVHHMSDTAHPNNNNNSNNDVKRSRKEGRTVHHPHEEEVRLSQEFTSQCDAVVQRVNALLDRAQQREEHIQRTLQASLDRSPPRPASRSPQPTNTPRWSGMFGTPQVPQAPPPTPAHPTENSHSHKKNHNNTNTNTNNNTNTDTASTTGWIGRMLWGSSEGPSSPHAAGSTPMSKLMKSPQSAESARGPRHTKQTQSRSPPPASPAEQGGSLIQRAMQRLSGRFSSPPPNTESPRRSRKSVVFKEPADLVTLTPPRAAIKASSEERRKEDVEPAPRDSLVYPPAPPPSAKKESRSRSRSPSSDEDKTHKMPDSDTPDVGAIIREYSHARALRELTKADLLAYTKQHHINVSMSSTKKEMFEVARRLAKDNAENAN
ncbi:hypothetical protein LSM04_000266 [Trypanosoma melophagium]|uniref:uncharacterized protein n=1 Tax=Trypanosoma melophagium TaxID=715481 RepID=UPI00351A0677|nr:hypothetical protein LSM04_000266 [Trypanosoma melophagium]